MFFVNTNQKKLDDSCVLSVILELYAKKLNREDVLMDEAGPADEDGFTTPVKSRRYFSLKIPGSPAGQRGTFRLANQTIEEIRLTYESLCQFLSIPFNPAGNMATSIENTFPFFVHFKIELQVFDVQHRLIFELPMKDFPAHPEYDYEIPTARLPRCRVMVAHHHLYLLEDVNLDFAKKMSLSQNLPELYVLKKPSSLFPLITKKKTTKQADEEKARWSTPNKLFFINDVEQIIQIVKSAKEERKEKKKEIIGKNGSGSNRRGNDCHCETKKDVRLDRVC